jgi:hypothetical protein
VTSSLSRNVDGRAQERIAGNAHLSDDPSGVDITTEMQDQQERTAAVLLLDDCGCAGRRGRVPRDASLSSDSAAPGFAGRLLLSWFASVRAELMAL